jgi:hypothetical protein
LILFPVAAKAQDYLFVNNPLNNGNSITGNVIDSALGLDVDAYIGSGNGVLDENGNDIVLPLFECVDLQDEISIPTEYEVQPEQVWNAAAWLIENEAIGGLSAAQDAGLQMAVWDVTYNGDVTFSGVTGTGDGVNDPNYWEGVYLAADNYGANKGEGVELVAIGGYGQTMEVAGGGSPVPGLPGPLAALPFLIGMAARRKRNA